MPVPTNRNKILPARGNFTDLDTNKSSLLDGEICYAIDQDQYYQKEGAVLVAVGATKAQGALADSALQSGDNVSVLNNDAGYLTNASLEISNADDVNITSIEEDQVLMWDGSDFVNGSAPVMIEVKNSSGATIDKGAAVYVSGTHTSGKPLISLADNDGVSTYPAIGLVHKDIANGDEGHVTVSGMLFGINTSFSGWSAGDALYLSDTAGVLTNTRPALTAQKVQKVALVTRVHATAGSVLVIGAGRTNDIPNDLVTLTGVALGDTNLGTFTGTTISDNESIKDALQTLETAVESAVQPSNVLTTTTQFGGDVSGTYNNISIDDPLSLTSTVSATPALTITNASGAGTGTGTGAIILEIVGDSDSLRFQNLGAGDYGIYNTQQNNGIEFNDGTAGLEFLYNGSTKLQFNSTYPSGNFLGTPSAAGNSIWHAGNDGAGSTLDADLLDGQQGSFYLNYNNFTNKPTIPTELDDLSNVDSATPTNGQVLTWDNANSYWAPADAADGTTDLSYTASTRVISSSTGTDATLPHVVASGNSGLMTGADKAKLDGIAAGAEVNVATNLSYTASTRVLASSTGTNATLPEVVAAGNSGLMTGADKTKLDGIESGATGDQTAAEILTAIKTVDGTGSGLDADTVDGIQASSFLRSDAADVMSQATSDTATLRIVNTGGQGTGIGTGAKIAEFKGDSDAIQIRNISTGDYGIYNTQQNNGFELYDGSGGVVVVYNSTHVLEFTSTSNYGDFKGNPTVNTNVIWHAGNDGAASGLDADTLDGQQGSYYLDYNNLTNTPTIGSGSFDGLTGKTSGTGDYSTSGDLVSGRGSGGVALTINDGYGNANVTFNHQDGVPEQNGNAGRIVVNTDNTAGANIDFQTKSNVTGNSAVSLTSVFNMTETGATCLGNTVWHAGNDGSNSGLDADTVDGIEAASFLRSDTADTTTGQLTIDVDNVASGALRILADQTVASQDFYFAQEITSNLSGTDTFTGDKEQGGIYMDINSETTGGGTGHEHRAYGMYIDLDVTGDSDVVAGIYAAVDVTPTEGTISNVYGLYGRAEDNGGAGNVSSVFGVRGEAVSDNSTSDINNMYGGYFHATNTADTGAIITAHAMLAEITIPASTGDKYGDSFVVRAIYDNNDTTAQTHTSYLFHGDYQGTLPTTAYGVYIADNVANYFGGSVEAAGQILVDNGEANPLEIKRSSQVGIEFNDTSVGSRYLGVNSGVLRWGSNLNHANNSQIWHAGNDGSGSGLDADTVDGLQASQFLRSDANDSTTGTITAPSFAVTNGGTITDVTGNYGSVKVTGGATTNWKGYAIEDGAVFMQKDDGTIFGLYDDTNNHWAVKHTKNGGTELYYDNSKKLQTTSAGGTLTGTWTGTVTSANNADTVDSLHAASFLRSDASDEYSGQTSGRVMRFRCVNGRNAGSTSGSLFPLEVYQDSNVANSDAAMAFHIAGRYATYFGLDRQTNDLFTGGWSDGSAKHKIWHAGNDGSGSGLDADTLDGIGSGSFLRSDANDTLSAIITGHASDTEVLRVTSSTYSNKYIYIGGWSNTNSNNISRIRNSGNLHIDSPANGNIYLNYYASNRSIYLGNTGQAVYAAGSNTVWHAGNDGSGSGLDADTVDGLQSGSFIRSDANDTGTGIYTTTGGSWAVGDGSGSTAMTTNDGGGNANITFNHVATVPDSNGSSARITASVDNTTGSIALQVGDSVTAGTSKSLTEALKLTTSTPTFYGNTAWHAGNDGAGSGLDADTLDGNQASAFALKSGATFTGEIQCNARLDVGNGTGSDHEIRIYKADNNVSDHIQFYNGTTRIGEIGCEDGTWLRINQETNKNIYTPRYIRADGGFFVDGTAKGINGSGNFVGGTIAGASDYGTLLRANANDTATGVITFSGGKIGVKVAPGGTPNSRNAFIALGDSDTGIAQNGDGQFEIWANNQEICNFDTGEIHAYKPTRIDNHFRVGTTSNFPGFNNSNTGCMIEKATNGTSLFCSRGDATPGYFNKNGNGGVVSFRRSGTENGQVTLTTNGVTYDSGSDHRLKTNIAPMVNSTDRVKLLNPVSFNWINGNEPDEGFIAHEVQTVFPHAVTNEYNEVDESGNPVYQMMDYGRITPLLTGALKEAIAKIEALEARVAQLESQ